MKSLRFLGVAVMAILCAVPSFAQSDIEVFGFFQSFATHSFRTQKQTLPMPGAVTQEMNIDNSVFSLQQANIFASKDLGNNFGAFVNLEFVNSYSSDRGWGSLNLQEAFVKYEGSNSFNIKAGLFLPQFNNLYEIYNRMPLLPYIIRPFVYETSLSGLLPPEDYLPSRGLVQAYGFFPAGDSKIDYAVYVGEAEDSYIVSDKKPMEFRPDATGTSLVSLKTIGARVGVRSGGLKLGASLTMDSDNHRADTTLNSPGVGNGDIPRMRVGADLSYSTGGLTLNAELIMVNYTLTDAQLAVIKANQMLGGDMNKLFYFASLQYDINDQLYVYGVFNSFKDNFSSVLKENLVGISGGFGYRANDNVVLKLQLYRTQLSAKFPNAEPFKTMGIDGKPIYDLSIFSVYGGVSVAF
ncbi:MAG: hypothetical protein LC116_02620 [Bacteroidetes bacterium]|nr:hypothetical protein [Bacteroidota bacterium]MCZ2132078.1 hypothetical protein [Bacteroidota bacterium]